MELQASKKLKKQVSHPKGAKLQMPELNFQFSEETVFELDYEFKGTWKKYAFTHISTDVPSIDPYKQERCKKRNWRKMRSWPI